MEKNSIAESLLVYVKGDNDMHIPVEIQRLIMSQSIWTTRINNYQKVIDNCMKENEVEPYPRSFLNLELPTVDECNRLATEIFQYLERS